MKVLRLVMFTAFVLAGMIAVTTVLRAQSTTGSVYGVVSDSTGATIPAASVTVKNVHTGISLSTTTNGSGEYTITTVNPGDYVVKATAQGFKTQTQTGVAVASNQNVHVTFALTAGAVTETMEIQADVTLVDTRGSQVAETIEQARF
ncbi:MAG: carboxypeptidase-like regulatory domain-containing protein, partial [Edaphobacter sp.]